MGIVHKDIQAAGGQVASNAFSTSANQTPVHSAAELTGEGPTAYIRHLDQVYTLRITRANKLILTK
ncbi:hemin uptake protein HemP [Neptunicoccus cionae]|uniref:hemin uptake protein HemP n=1 Tax=Neptunicoccus cionae TaxID=2035344 RepID=UPI000C764E94|nr:hemin uptake protein HemP [Amylibacter cionae]PLS22989.1 hemin uptake protein HemP [Amylibacter cionae]